MSFFTAWAYLCWIAMPVVMAVLERITRRRTAARAVPAAPAGSVEGQIAQ